MRILVAIFCYTIWGIADYVNCRLLFDQFHIMEPQKGKRYCYLWLIYFGIATYAYSAAKLLMPDDGMNNSQRMIYTVAYLAFYFRMVPFLWSKYGVSVKLASIYLLYELMNALLAESIAVMLAEFHIIIYSDIYMGDLLEGVTLVGICGILLILFSLKKGNKLNIWFSSVTTWEYGLMILTLYLVGTVETVINIAVDLEYYHSPLKYLVLISKFLIIFLILRMMLLNGRNSSLKVIVRVLEEQMGKLTQYYSELSRKDEELRQFRHDTKNLMLALQLMIKEGKNEQAIDYIEKMGERYQKSSKCYDTGNFIADALLNAKNQEAEKNQTTIRMNGFFPSEKISDVDMVILLSNLLDNAIEACAQMEGDKKIVINSVLQKKMWCMEVRNPTKNTVPIHRNHIGTSKENKEIHGFGLRNIERVVKDYQGVLKLTCENNEFMAKATFVLQSQED